MTERGANDWFRDFVVKEHNVTAIQNSLKVFGEKTIIGKEYDPTRLAMGW
jgi:hypothetical protein